MVSQNSLLLPVTELKGIGPALGKHLCIAGLKTISDMIWFVPRYYDDVRHVRTLDESLHQSVGNRVTLSGFVQQCRYYRRGRSRWLDLRISKNKTDNEPLLVVRWFYAYPTMEQRFPQNSEVTLSGILRHRASFFEMGNPDIISIIKDGESLQNELNPIITRYPTVIGVPALKLRKACHAALELGVEHIQDGIPSSARQTKDWISIRDAIMALHHPSASLTTDEVDLLNQKTSVWHQRLVYDEMFFLSMAVEKRRQEYRQGTSVSCTIPNALIKTLEDLFGFVFTPDQTKAINEITTDITKEIPMNRLLQGDVGSGKTAVSFAAIYQVFVSKKQSAFMVPTTVLAQQHYDVMKQWGDKLGMKVELLTSFVSASQRRRLLTFLKNGAIDLLIGTQSLLSDEVMFSDLGLVVIDEQHCFGVEQRSKIRRHNKKTIPHLLVMTATPIPRTLALTIHGDLDLTVIHHLPKGRIPIETVVLHGKQGRNKAYKNVAKKIQKQEGVFVICPLIDKDEDRKKQYADVVSITEELKQKNVSANIGCLHGKLSWEERLCLMKQFATGDLDVLVSTTVVEIGIDIPRATMMVIENADHFGLSQLHQLRGRIGRSNKASECVLLTNGQKTDEGTQRLSVMAQKNNDGFSIAEEDLRIRGHGELFGIKQAGLPSLRFGMLPRDLTLFIQAKQTAQSIIHNDPTLMLEEHRIMKTQLDSRVDLDRMYHLEGG